MNDLQFTYDSVFPPEDSQEYMYDNMVRPLVDFALVGKRL